MSFFKSLGESLMGKGVKTETHAQDALSTANTANHTAYNAQFAGLADGISTQLANQGTTYATAMSDFDNRADLSGQQSMAGRLAGRFGRESTFDPRLASIQNATDRGNTSFNMRQQMQNDRLDGLQKLTGLGMNINQNAMNVLNNTAQTEQNRNAQAQGLAAQATSTLWGGIGSAIGSFGAGAAG